MKTRAEEERKERKNKLMQAKDDFKKMMEDAKLNNRSVEGPFQVFDLFSNIPTFELDYLDGL